ncbi:MAG TPA: hypothetical protein P5340_08250 [Defluviicoccus sp.]|nr:hypothetical protein [Defluviicoccus sp.]
MRQKDYKAFFDTARDFGVFILVRQLNEASVQYIGQRGFVPKPLDCKAKSAKRDFAHPSLGWLKVGGLVVDPTLPGFEAAFGVGPPHEDALKAWRAWMGPNGAETPLAVAGGADGRPQTDRLICKRYFVDLDQKSMHYGCVKWAKADAIRVVAGTGRLVACCGSSYLHGDYDLYAIVSASNPAVNVRVTAPDRSGYKHTRGPLFMDVQGRLKSLIGVPMVRHGEEETFTATPKQDDVLYVFFPDGSDPICLEGPQDIDRFYQERLDGRQRFSDGSPGTPHFGLWEKLEP